MEKDFKARLSTLTETIDGLKVITLAALQTLEREFNLSRREAELAALEAGVLPRRYLRSYGTVGIEGQIKLLRSTVAVVGLGGLGGNVVEALARMGVGRIIAVDGDTFVDHNLNRQLLSEEATLTRSKAEAARARLAAINAAVEVVAHAVHLTPQNVEELLGGAALLPPTRPAQPSAVTGRTPVPMPVQRPGVSPVPRPPSPPGPSRACAELRP